MPKKTIETIVESGNDYVIQLKGNCPGLRADILDFIADEEPESTWDSADKSRGRIDNRRYSIYRLQGCKLRNKWNHINTVTVVKREGKRNGKKYHQKALYISNIYLEAREMSKGIRGHWSIENNLHRTKDVVQKEDCNYIKAFKLAKNVSVLQTFAISLIRLFEGKSVQFANEKYANNIEKTLKLISNKLRI